MAVERTLSIVKPDAVAKNAIGQIYSRFEQAGLNIVAARMRSLSQKEAEGFAAFVASLAEKPFRARQLKRWMHRLGEADFARMSDIAKPLREKLLRTACVSPPRIVSDSLARDGTRKWLLDVGNGNAVEAVFIPETNRGTLCISTQAGCTLACQFCSTGRDRKSVV